MRIRVTPSGVFPGIEAVSNGVHQFLVGALADYLNPGDGIILYTPNSDFSACDVFAVAEVVGADPESDSCSLDIRRYSSVIQPDAKARHKWRDNPYLCLDKNKVEKYQLLDLFVEAFNDQSWALRPIQDVSMRFAKFDLSRRTLLPKSGFVYLFKYEDAYKIGMAVDIAKRKKQIESAKKLDLDKLHEISSNDYQRAEATLHCEFAHCRRGKSELFDLSPFEVERILAISQMDFPLS
jgi:hypothetical protein